MSTPFKVTTTFWDHATLWSEDDSDAGHSTDGGRVYGITRWRYVECDHYGCKPVAVIAYDDREQVGLLVDAYVRNMPAKSGSGGPVLTMQAALREFANPTPPKPDEPTGLGAVVETETGERYVRRSDACKPVWVHATGSTFPLHWKSLAAVKVLSEGVTP